MDVRCPQCSTLYEIADDQVKTAIVTLKCSQCQHVFRFESKASVVQENQRRWMVRSSKTGDILYLNSFEVLHQWIMERKVKKTDEISRTGNKWVKLEEIGEFMPVFLVVESISNIAGVPKEEEEAPPQALKPPSSEEPIRERVRTSIQFGGQTEEVTRRERPTQPTPGPKKELPPNPKDEPTQRVSQPTPAPKPKPKPAPDVKLEGSLEADSEWSIGGNDAMESQSYEPAPKSGSGLTPLIALLVVALVGGGAYAYLFEPDLFNSVVHPAVPDREVVSLSKSDAGADAATEVEAPAEPNIDEQLAKAYTAAFDAKWKTEEHTWNSIIDATRPGFDQALGVATEEAENWAEGGAIDEQLKAARRKLERGNARSALKMYKEILDHDAKNAEAITGIGWANVEMGNYDEAVTNFKRSIDFNSRFGDAYIGLGTAERQRGNPKAAYDAYDLYLGRLPKGPKASIARYQMKQLREQLGL